MNKKFGVKRTRDPRGDSRPLPTRSPRPNAFPGPPGTPRQGPGGRGAAGAPALAGRRVRQSWGPARLRGRGCVSKAGLTAHLEGGPPEQPLIARSASPSAPQHP